jgi:predicted HD phosphohydrolase
MTTGRLDDADSLLRLLAELQGQPGDDRVDAGAHLLQTAEHLAAEHPDDADLVVAGLVHDLASSLEPGVADHARRGAELVGPLLGPRVAALVAGHAEAKRYLVATEPGYAALLSPDSTFTLIGQGGPMDADEVAAFAARVDVDALLALRRADDRAKDPAAVVRPVEVWRPRVEQVVGAQALST